MERKYNVTFVSRSFRWFFYLSLHLSFSLSFFLCERLLLSPSLIPVPDSQLSRAINLNKHFFFSLFFSPSDPLLSQPDLIFLHLLSSLSLYFFLSFPLFLCLFKSNCTKRYRSAREKGERVLKILSDSGESIKGIDQKEGVTKVSLSLSSRERKKTRERERHKKDLF